MKKQLWLVLATVLSTAVFGQNEQILRDSLAEELIITHSKNSISVLDAHKPHSIISADEIRSYPLDDIASILDQQLGMRVVGARSNISKDKSIFLQGASGEFTLILLDGVPLTDPSAIGGSFDLRSINLHNLERIEILRGGQSGLYGTDAIAGVINLITSRENSDGLTGSISAGLGSYATYQSSGHADISLEDHIKLKLSGSWLDSEGISEAIDQDDIGFDRDGIKRLTGSASLDYEITPDITLRPYLRLADFQGEYDGGSFFDSEETYQTDWLSIGLHSQYQLSDGMVSMHLGRVATDRRFDTAFGVFDFNGRYTDFDLHAYQHISDRLTATLGIHHQQLSLLDTTGTVDNPDMSLWSPYTQLDYKFSDQSSIHIGSRLNFHSTFGSNVNYSAGIKSWLSKQLKVYASWATSFKAPNLFQLFGQFGPNPDLNPQKGSTIQIGLESYDIGPLSKVKINAFKRDVSDLIIFDFTDGYLNVPNQNDLGLEAYVEVPMNKLSLSLGYVYLFGELDDMVGAPVENLLRRPRHQFDIRLSGYLWTGGHIGFDLRYTGDRDDSFFDNTTFLTEDVLLPAYWLGDLSISQSIADDISISLALRNLFDTDYEEIVGFATQGRNFILNIRKDF